MSELSIEEQLMRTFDEADLMGKPITYHEIPVHDFIKLIHELGHRVQYTELNVLGECKHAIRFLRTCGYIYIGQGLKND